MGSSLTTSVGVGVILPSEEEDGHPSGFKTIVEEYYSSMGDDFDFGEMYDDLLDNYHLLELSFGGVFDYDTYYAVMVKSTVTRIWDGLGVVDPSQFVISNEEFDQLAQLISDLGLEKIDPRIIVSSNYG